ncbi:MAG: PAS domain S-box protein [Methanomassiliicoccales archaeon]|nr:PAS domain S-box protein [Methanomassiliicoccales archaeon]
MSGRKGSTIIKDDLDSDIGPLRRAEEKFRAIFNNSNDSILLHGLTPEGLPGNFIDVNKAACDRLGYTEEELMNLSVVDIDADDSHVEGVIKELNKKGHTAFECVHLSKDGKRIPVEVNAHLFTLDNEEVILSIARDVTERECVEKKTIESQSALSSLIDHAPFGIMVIGIDKRVKRVNEAALRLLDYESPGEIIGTICHETLCPAEIDQCPIIDLGQVVDRSERIFLTREGEKIPILKSVVRMQLDGEDVLLESFIDIKEIKEAQKALEMSEEAYRNLVENSSDLIFSTSDDGDINFANAAFKRALGFSEEEIPNVSFSSIIIGSPAERSPLKGGSADGIDIQNLELKLVTKMDKILEVEGIIDGEFVDGELINSRGYLRDITQANIDERRIKHLNRLLRATRQINKLKAYEKNPGDLIKFTCEILVRTRGFKNAWVVLFDDEGSYYLSGESGLGETFLPIKERFERNNWVRCVNRALQHAGTVAISDFKRCDDCPLVQECTGNGILVSRLEHGVKLFGIMVISMPVEYLKDIEEHRLLDEITDEIAFALYSRDLETKEQIYDALRKANTNLNILSDITRHDILNQVTALSGYLNLLEDRFPEEYWNEAQMIDRMKRISRTIQRQISFTKDYQNMGVTVPQWNNIGKIVLRATHGLGEIENIELMVDTGSLEIFGDQMLEKVFLNLVDDSIRHGVTTSEIRIYFKENDEGGILYFEDDGVGIPEGLKTEIFNKGVGLHTGYGLFLAKEILGITGMSIRETGTEGKGARFEIVVPPNVYRWGH